MFIRIRGPIKNNSMRKLAAKTLMEILPPNIADRWDRKDDRERAPFRFRCSKLTRQPSTAVELHGSCAGIFNQSMGARNWVGIELSYRPVRLNRLAELIPWNRFLGSWNVYKYGLWGGVTPSPLYHLSAVATVLVPNLASHYVSLDHGWKWSEDKPTRGFPLGRELADFPTALIRGFFQFYFVDLVRLPARLHIFKLHPNVQVPNLASQPS